MQLPQLSYSMRAMYKSCPRKVYFRYVAGIEKKDGPRLALIVGKTFHAGLEKLRSGISLETTMADLSKSLRDELQVLIDKYDTVHADEEISKMEAYLTGYKLRYAKDDTCRWEPEIKLEHGAEVAFVDGLHIDFSGQSWVVEDKTRSMFEPAMIRALPLDEQLLSYAAMLKNHGYGIPFFCYRETLKCRLKRNKSESSEAFRNRVISIYSNEQDKYYREIIHQPSDDDIVYYREKRNQANAVIRQKLKYCHKFEQWPHNGSSCCGKFGACDYLDFCSGCGQIGEYVANEKEPLDGGRMRNFIISGGQNEA